MAVYARGEATSGYRLYVIEIMPRWHPLTAPGIQLGKQCFYVGETSKPRAERLREHRTGTVKFERRARHGSPREDLSGKIFRRLRKAKGGHALENKRDVVLRRTLTADIPEELTRAEAEAVEQALVYTLRAEMHAVYPEASAYGSVFADYSSRVAR